MKRVSMCWIALVALAAGSARAQDVLTQVPPDAIAVLVVPKLEAVNKFRAAGVKMGIPDTDLFVIAKAMTGIGDGLKLDGSGAVAVFLDDRGPQPAIFLPGDHKMILAALSPKDAGDGISKVTLADGTEALAAAKGAYTVLVPPTATGLLKKIVAGKAGFDAGPLKAWAAGQDAAVVAGPMAVRMAAQAGAAGLAEAKRNLAGAPKEAKMFQGIIEGVEPMLAALPKELTHAGAALSVDASGNLSLQVKGAFVSGGTWASAAGGISVPSGGLFAGLPQGRWVFLMGDALSHSAMAYLQEMNVRMLAAMVPDAPEAVLKKLEAGHTAMAKNMRGMSMVMGVGKPGDTLLGNTAAIVRVSDARTYLDAYETVMKATGELMRGAKVPGVPEIEVKRGKVAGRDTVTFSMDLLKALPAGGDPQAAKMFEQMFGKGGKMTGSIIAADATTVVMSYGDAVGDAVLAAIKAGGSGPNLRGTANLIPQGAQSVMAFDARALFDMVNRIMGVVGGGMKMPEFPEADPAAIAVKLDSAGVEFRLVLPENLLRAIGEFAKRVKANPPRPAIS